MKKFILFFLTVVFLASSSYGVYLFLNKSKLSPEDILPEEPILYVKVSDVKGTIEEIQASALWQTLSSLDYKLLLEKNNTNPGVLDVINDFIANMSDSPTGTILDTFFSREIALAIYPSALESAGGGLQELLLKPGAMQELASGIYLVTRVGPEFKVAEFITAYIDEYGEDVDVQTVEYKERTLHLVDLKKVGVKLSLVRLQDLVVIGVGDRPARNSVDVHEGIKGSLVDQTEYKELKKDLLSPANFIGAFDMAGAFEIAKEQMGLISALASKEDVDAAIDQLNKSLGGMEWITFSAQISDLTKLSTNVKLDFTKMDSDMAVFYECPAKENKSLRFIPSDVIGYQWSSCIQLDEYWKQFNNEMDNAAPANERDEFLAQLSSTENFLGVDIEGELLPAIGDELGGFLSDLRLGPLMPIPKLLLFVKLNDQAFIDGLLSKLLQGQPLIAVQSETYSEVDIQYIALPLGADIQPSYAYLDDYLLFAINRDVLKSSIDAYNDKSLSILSNESFKRVDDGLTDDNLNIGFFKVGESITKFREIFDWSSQWFTARDSKKAAFKAGTQRKLDDVLTALRTQEDIIKDYQVRIENSADRIYELEQQGLDVTSAKDVVLGFEEGIRGAEREIEALREKRIELEEIIRGYNKEMSAKEERQFYLDNVLFPILDGLEYIESLGSRTTSDDEGVMKSLFIFDIRDY